MGRVGEEITTILTAIIGVAILAVIVSKSADTSNVIKSAGDAFSKSLGVAISPITAISPVTGGGAGIAYN